MCVPCKIIFNQGAQAALDKATKMRELLTEEIWGNTAGLDSPEIDDFLFNLARAEVEFCDQVDALGHDFARLVGAGERWQKLMVGP